MCDIGLLRLWCLSVSHLAFYDVCQVPLRPSILPVYPSLPAGRLPVAGLHVGGRGRPERPPRGLGAFVAPPTVKPVVIHGSGSTRILNRSYRSCSERFERTAAFCERSESNTMPQSGADPGGAKGALPPRAPSPQNI